MKRKRRSRLVLLTVLGLGASLAAPAMAAESVEQVEWGACPADVVAGAAPHQLQCATVPVPLDYADPGGTRIDLMISRLASPNPEKRRGVLMLNPGGPGGSGLTLSALLMSKGLPASVAESYDVIGMDTRGVGHSSPVSCGFTTTGPYVANIPPYAVDDAAVTAQAKVAQEVAEQCAANDRDGRLRHLTTANIARDLDRIRVALGEEKASFLGYSYGSALGAAYASMFPERSDRIVLDSNIGDTHLDRDGLRRYALGMEQTFPDFAKWVAQRHDAYGLGRTPEEVRQTYFEIAGRLDEQPVDGLDGALFRLSTFGGLFGETVYGRTAQLWQAMRNSAPAKDALVGDQLSPADNSLSVFLSVTCNDVEWPEDVDTYRRGVAEDRERYPLYGAATANILPCAYWSHEPAEPPVAINDEGPENVLIVQNHRDAPTPHRGGELLREKFADRSRMVSVDGSGHGVYVLGGNACALNVTTSFLVDGKLPAQDRVCGAAAG
ncbi:alpha/beta hydrolase [Amycolatopsis magusensis]|uniref:alpha/beta hydrolase n=1 Tax=Amycolatopsis magusensis TaxID=882444 RepID=UPI0024A926A5|nr:alpha/beta hydrolase [Amycolatopsis magusensis]MDI5982140.1 alpha/beta hydrolase [Amycolatopsis magusensis]